MKNFFLFALLLGTVSICRADAVRLKLVGPDGKPVAGALVRWTEIKIHIASEKSVLTLTNQTEATGKATFASRDSLAPGKYSWNLVEVWAQVTAPGLAITKAQLHAGDNEIKLGAGHPLRGRVLDDQGQPVAGAALMLLSLLPFDGRADEMPRALSFKSAEAPRAVSNADGTWEMAGMPKAGSAEIAVVAPHFCQENLRFDVSQGAPPISLERGAALRGRLLRPDGMGAGGVTLYVTGVNAPQITQADGTFGFDGLGEGEAWLTRRGSSLESDGQGRPFFVPTKRVADLKRGETLDIGDWKTKAGVHIRGRVINKATKTGVAGVGFALYRSEAPTNSQSDKDGRFDFLALDDIEELVFETDDFYGATRKPLPTPKNGVIDMGTIELEPRDPRPIPERGQRVEGTIRTEAGLPASVSFHYTKSGQPGPFPRSDFSGSDETGYFKLEGVEEGSYTIAIDGAHTLSGGRFTLGDGPPKPVNIVVEGHNPRVVSAAQGRVLDEKGAPVAGAKVRLRISGMTVRLNEQTVLSGEDGRFSAPFATVEGVPVVLGVSHSGFAPGAMRGALVRQDDGIWRGDLRVQHRGLAVRGRVVDAAGRPVVGAFVAPFSSWTLPVATDANGAFALVDEPMQDVNLVASDGPRLASLKVANADAPLQIVLPDTPAPKDKAALADELLKDARLGFRDDGGWQSLGPKRMVALFLASPATMKGGSNYRRWTNFLRTLCDRAPQLFLEREADIHDHAPEWMHAEVARSAMVARASSTDPTQRAKVKAWLDGQRGPRELTPQNVQELLGIAEVAARFHPGGGKEWLSAAFQIAGQLDPLQNDGKNGDDGMYEWATLAARTDPDAPLQLVQSWPPAPAARLIEEALGTFAARDDAPSARHAFAALEKLAAQARNIPEVEGKPKAIISPTDLLGYGRNSLARALAKTDPGTALEQTELLNSYQRPLMLLVVARAATDQKRYDIARRAVRELFEEPIDFSSLRPEAAAIADEFDPVLAEELWAKLNDAHAQSGGRSPGAYARARAAKYPGQSRILLERAWASAVVALAETAHTDKTIFSYSAWSMRDIVGAMARVAPERAITMLDRLPEKDDLRAQTRTAIAKALLGGAAQEQE